MVDHGITDVIVDNLSGLYADNNPQDLADKLLELIKNDELHHKLSKNGIELASKFSARQQGLKLEALYQELLKQNLEALRDPTSHIF